MKDFSALSGRGKISPEQFANIEKRHGKYSSWAVWGEGTGRPKSGMSDITIFDNVNRKNLLEQLRNNVVMVGLNFSRKVGNWRKFSNFHGSHPYANNFKIRYAFAGTEVYGAYMTDAKKNVPTANARELDDLLRKNPEVLESSKRLLIEELRDLNSKEPPFIIAFGGKSFNLVKQMLP